ncbi:MAG: hypothetical protein E6J90_23575 [Deltaproteobacteria bacterium]|nr:MAG: hypothetical protein E6J90_23575 [Deltaproteobacteria bacterium]
MPDHRARRIAVCLTALAACSSTHKPEADPVRLDPIFKAIDRNTPTPGAAPICSPKEMTELDSPAARELIDPSTDDTTRRQAAYELLSAPFYLVYRVDVVDAPMALGVKDLKRGTVSLRALRFDRQGNIVCAKVVAFQNTLEKNDWAITKSNLAVMDPKISAALRDDLRDQLLKHVAALGRPD